MAGDAVRASPARLTGLDTPGPRVSIMHPRRVAVVEPSMKPALIALAFVFVIIATPLAAADCVRDVRCDRPGVIEPACHAAWPTIHRANALAEQLVCG